MKNVKSPILIKLTKKQLKELEPVFAIVNQECEAGRKGMAVGQAYEEGILQIGFVPAEIAKKLVGKGPIIEREVPQ